MANILDRKIENAGKIPPFIIAANDPNKKTSFF